MQNEDKPFRLKEYTVYEKFPYAPEEKRKAIMESRINSHKKAIVTGSLHV